MDCFTLYQLFSYTQAFTWFPRRWTSLSPFHVALGQFVFQRSQIKCTKTKEHKYIWRTNLFLLWLQWLICVLTYTVHSPLVVSTPGTDWWADSGELFPQVTKLKNFDCIVWKAQVIQSSTLNTSVSYVKGQGQSAAFPSKLLRKVE